MTPGTLDQLARSSKVVIRSITICAVRWLRNTAGLGLIVSGWRNTVFSMPSSMGVLWTQEFPLWMSAGVDPG